MMRQFNMYQTYYHADNYTDAIEIHVITALPCDCSRYVVAVLSDSGQRQKLIEVPTDSIFDVKEDATRHHKLTKSFIQKEHELNIDTIESLLTFMATHEIVGTSHDAHARGAAINKMRALGFNTDQLV